MTGPWPILQSLDEHAAAIAALPASGPLPIRTAVVSSERQAHALRRALLRSGRGEVLAGTRFVGAATLAREVLEERGVSFTPGEEGLRPARLLALLEEVDLALEYFSLELVRSTPGWPEAFAGAIADLEGAGLRPAGLPATTAAWRDLRLLWTRIDGAAGRSLTASRVYDEAASLLRAGARAGGGPILAAVTGGESAVQARFLAALPGATLALVAARPLRPGHLDRLERLFGPDARVALAGAPLPPEGPTERDVLVRHLFAPPELLADRARSRSRGPDGTVSLEEHAGVEAEIEAAAEWVAREVLERRTPLEEIAVLVPSRDPLAAMVASRIARLPWPGGPFPVHVAGGVPLAGTAGGSRALALVRALRAFLPAEQVAGVLPSLRIQLEERAHLTAGEASGLAWGLGTVGGGPARPEGALDWPERAAARETGLAEEVASLTPVADEREGRSLRAELVVVRASLPALAALSALSRQAVDDRPLAELGPAVCAFLEEWLLDPGRGAPVHALLREALSASCAGAIGATVRGIDALGVVEEVLLSIRLPTLRFGSPAVYVGTIAGAVGLRFEAVRTLGLAEGALPSAAREDAVLPDRMRREASPLVPVAEDRVLAQLHAFDRALRAAASRVALSAPHSDLERSERETSSLLVEVGAALGRPDERSQATIPDLASLSRTSFGPARRAASAFRAAHPLSAGQWLDLAAATSAVDPSWSEAPHLALARVLALRNRTGLGPADGLLGSDGPFPVFPGLAPERPVSASALETLVGCPLRFLYQRVLKWEEPAGAASVRELDPLTYGSLLHGVADRFYSAHGADFVARRGGLPGWQERARAIADEELARLRGTHPLVGPGVVEKERSRLLGDLDSFLEYDWQLPLDRFVGVELPFDGLALDAGDGRLHVRGYIDRIDVEEGHALVRDLKTGRDHPREGDEAGPVPTRDVQLGLYSLVAKARAREWKLPPRRRAAYVYPRHGDERAFRGDHRDLETATRGWLGVAHSLLAARAFPPTPDAEDCRFCAFQATCDGPERAAPLVGDVAEPIAAFFALKTRPEEDEA